MSDQSSSQPTSPEPPHLPEAAVQPAVECTVDAGNGLTLPGWAVRTDTVVVHAGGLTAPVRVRLGDDWITAVDSFETQLILEVSDESGASGESVPWTALELPEGTLPVDVEAFPPGLTPPAPDPTRYGARVAFWCLVFPRMRGC